MAVTGYYAPHETRMLALQLAVEFANGGKNSKVEFQVKGIVGIARDFEAYLTETPVPGYESEEE